MQMQYKLRNPDSSGFKVKDDFSQFKTGDEGDEASLDVHEVSSGAEAISEDDSNAEAFKNEDSICPDLDKDAVSQLSSATGGADGCVRYAPGDIGDNSWLLNRWSERWSTKENIYEGNQHHFEGTQADEDRADPAVARATTSGYIPPSCFRLNGIREWARKTFESCKAIDCVESNQWPAAVAMMCGSTRTLRIDSRRPSLLALRTFRRPLKW